MGGVEEMESVAWLSAEADRVLTQNTSEFQRVNNIISSVRKYSPPMFLENIFTWNAVTCCQGARQSPLEPADCWSHVCWLCYFPGTLEAESTCL